jgi:allantoate deiminase
MNSPATTPGSVLSKSSRAKRPDYTSRPVPSPASPERIAEAIEVLAQLSEPGRGVSRLAYTPLERRAHDLFAQWMTAAGCKVEVDPAGNTIATRPGTIEGAAALGTGSHLDSVYSGGAYDGVTGVVAGVEIARLLAEANVQTAHPLRFVAFAGEEGARFGQACIGSKLAAGLSSYEELQNLRDKDGISIAEAMKSVGLSPETAASHAWRPNEWAAFLELHIEQGSILEATGRSVGPVDLISGSTRLSFTLIGRPSHTGGTPMRGRSDALAAAAEAVLIAESLALDSAHRGTRATVGKLSVHPDSITTIPGRVQLSLDVRDIDADRQREAAATIVRRVLAVCKRRSIEFEVRLLADTSPVILPVWVRQAVIESARQLGTKYRVLSSGASHDAQMINTKIPTALIFVPSKSGLSHVPEEWTDSSQIATGVDVLARTLLNLDTSLTRH